MITEETAISICHDYYVKEMSHKELETKYGMKPQQTVVVITNAMVDPYIDSVIRFFLRLKQEGKEQVLYELPRLMGHKDEAYYKDEFWTVPVYHSAEMLEETKLYMRDFRGLQDLSFTERLGGIKPYG